jgi:uncharacterized coiled-coil protein SlyX
MGKVEKKRKKLEERIEFLQDEMKTALTKKTSDVKEINVPEQLRKISELQAQLRELNYKN